MFISIKILLLLKKIVLCYVSTKYSIFHIDAINCFNDCKLTFDENHLNNTVNCAEFKILAVTCYMFICYTCCRTKNAINKKLKYSEKKLPWNSKKINQPTNHTSSE